MTTTTLARASGLLIALALIVAAPRRAGAATIFSQPIVTGAGAFASDPEVAQLEADNFTLAAADSVISLKWWGTYSSGGPPSDFAIRFFADSGSGFPALVPFSSQNVTNVAGVDTGLTAHSSNIFVHSANLPLPVALAGGTSYYLSIINLTAGEQFNWATIANGHPHWFRNNDAGPWVLSSDDFGFELYDTPVNGVAPVPLPAAAWAGMALIGSLGVVRAARARARDAGLTTDA